MGDSRLFVTLYCVITFTTTLPARASIKQFSASLVSTQEAAPAKPSPITKVYKASVSQNKLPELKTAILWHAPPYTSLSIKLSPSEQGALDEEAMQILINAAAERNEELMKAKNLISKKKPLVFKIGQLLMSKERDNDLINKASNYIYASYQNFKPFYQMAYNRDNNLLERHIQAQRELELVAGPEAVASVQALLNGGRI